MMASASLAVAVPSLDLFNELSLMMALDSQAVAVPSLDLFSELSPEM